MAPHGHHRPERSWHGREANRPRVGHTQSPGPVAGNLGGGSVHVHDRTSCNAAVLAHVHTRSGPRKPGLRVMPEARACCVGDLAPSPARPTARPRRGNTVLLPRLDSDSDGHMRPRPEPNPSWDTRVGPAQCCATTPGQRGDRLSSHPLRPGSPTRMRLDLGTPVAATRHGTGRAAGHDPHARLDRAPRRGPEPTPPSSASPTRGTKPTGSHGTKNLEAKTAPVSGKTRPRATVLCTQRPGQ